MVIEINKDIDRYKESVVMGLTAKQLLFSIVAVAAGAGVVLSLYKQLGMTMSVYVAIPAVVPIAMGGFYSYNGMSFYEVLRRRWQHAFQNRTLLYVSEENENVLKSLAQANIEKQNRKQQKKKQKQKQNGKQSKKQQKKQARNTCRKRG